LKSIYKIITLLQNTNQVLERITRVRQTVFDDWKILVRRRYCGSNIFGFKAGIRDRR